MKNVSRKNKLKQKWRGLKPIIIVIARIKPEAFCLPKNSPERNEIFPFRQRVPRFSIRLETPRRKNVEVRRLKLAVVSPFLPRIFSLCRELSVSPSSFPVFVWVTIFVHTITQHGIVFDHWRTRTKAAIMSFSLHESFGKFSGKSLQFCY